MLFCGNRFNPTECWLTKTFNEHNLLISSFQLVGTFDATDISCNQYFAQENSFLLNVFYVHTWMEAKSEKKASWKAIIKTCLRKKLETIYSKPNLYRAKSLFLVGTLKMPFWQSYKWVFRAYRWTQLYSILFEVFQ